MGIWKEVKAPGKKLLVFEYGSDCEQDSVTVRMLINNQIIGLVPCSFSQVDDINSVKFDISSRLRFSDFIERQTTFPIAAGLLISMSRLFIELRKYMIGVEALVLDDFEKMFVDLSVPMAEFVINPIFSEQRRIEYRSFFINIISNLKLDEAGRRYVGDMLSLVNEAGFTLEKFVEGLEQLRTSFTTGGQIAVQESRVNAAAYAVPDNNEQVKVQIPVLEKSAVAVNAAKKTASDIRDKFLPGEKVKDKDKKDKVKKDKDKAKDSGGVGGLLKLVFGKHKSDESKEKSKSKERKKVKVKSKASEKPAPVPMGGFAVPGIDDDVVGNYSNPNPAVSIDKPVVEQKPVEEKKPEVKAPEFKKPEVRTPVPVAVPVSEPDFVTDYIAPVTRIADDDETTQLIDDGLNFGCARLVGAGMREVIEIDKDTFFIGRDPKECVDYVINDGRVSRRHASIVHRGEHYYLIDNKSSNHTYLNGRMLTPYDEYEINTGDLIIFAAVEFTFEL
ncbi:MAG: FHA domain-containing protein [Ruminococcus sp.]|nr:FHA domain-containing protein [Ruminococcus sp.]